MGYKAYLCPTKTPSKHGTTHPHGGLRLRAARGAHRPLPARGTQRLEAARVARRGDRRAPLRRPGRGAARGAAARLQQYEGDPRADRHAQALGGAHRGFLPRASRAGRLRARLRRPGRVPLVVHRGQPQEVEGGGGADPLRSGRARGARRGRDRRAGCARAAGALPLDGRPHLRRAARAPGAHTHPALPGARERGDRQHALPDGLFEDRGIGGRADGRAALHARGHRRDALPGLRLRGGDAARGRRHLPAGQGGRRRAPRHAHRALRDHACDPARAARQAGGRDGRGDHLGAHARVAAGPRLAHPHGGHARRRAGGGAVGALRPARLLHGGRGAR